MGAFLAALGAVLLFILRVIGILLLVVLILLVLLLLCPFCADLCWEHGVLTVKAGALGITFPVFQYPKPEPPPAPENPAPPKGFGKVKAKFAAWRAERKRKKAEEKARKKAAAAAKANKPAQPRKKAKITLEILCTMLKGAGTLTKAVFGALRITKIQVRLGVRGEDPAAAARSYGKLAGDFRGDPAAALLEALDPEQNSTFNDHFIDIPFDLSHVLFITTANDLGSIPGPLRDRMDVIELPSYTRVEKYNIARKHLLPKQLKACGLTGKVTLSQSALYGIIDGYTREAGVRNLERTITSVLRKCARKIAAGEVESVSVTGTMLEQLLGPRFVKPDFLNRTNAVGIANGLAWTSVGGETLPIEVQVMDNGSGKITVTGSLGDVMKESAQLAVTWVRVHAAEYGIDPEKLKKCDLHIHAPEGAVPKDGPSAGVTLTTALVSCLSGIPVRGDVAMTGEITLHGNVLPIGGLREKSMAAYREGMKTVLIPKDNEPDLYEVDDEVKKNLTFLPMQSLTQVLNAALLKPNAAKSAAGRTHTKKKAAEKHIPAAAEKPQPGAVC